MLQVGVGDARLAEPRRQLHPEVQEHLEVLGPLEVLLDELVERQPFDPAHLQHRESLALMRMPCSRYWKSTVKGSFACSRWAAMVR